VWYGSYSASIADELGSVKIKGCGALRENYRTNITLPSARVIADPCAEFLGTAGKNYR